MPLHTYPSIGESIFRGSGSVVLEEGKGGGGGTFVMVNTQCVCFLWLCLFLFELEKEILCAERNRSPNKKKFCLCVKCVINILW